MDVYVEVFVNFFWCIVKFLFVDFVNYDDVCCEGICCVFEDVIGDKIFCFVKFLIECIDWICMGIIVVINVLFECKGECIVLCII